MLLDQKQYLPEGLLLSRLPVSVIIACYSCLSHLSMVPFCSPVSLITSNRRLLGPEVHLLHITHSYRIRIWLDALPKIGDQRSLEADPNHTSSPQRIADIPSFHMIKKELEQNRPQHSTDAFIYTNPNIVTHL